MIKETAGDLGHVQENGSENQMVFYCFFDALHRLRVQFVGLLHQSDYVSQYAELFPKSDCPEHGKLHGFDRTGFQSNRPRGFRPANHRKSAPKTVFPEFLETTVPKHHRGHLIRYFGKLLSFRRNGGVCPFLNGGGSKNRKLFEDETEDAFFSVRTTSINAIYTNNQLYDARQGIITYIRKVYDSERKVIGYLFLDISPKYLYSNFFSYTDDLGEAVSFIVFDSDNYLQTVANEPYAGYLKYLATGQPVRTKDLRYIVATQSFMDFDAELVTLIPLKPFYRKQALLTFPIILISLVFIVLSCIIGNRESKKVVDSLTALNTKMKEAYKEFEKS